MTIVYPLSDFIIVALFESNFLFYYLQFFSHNNVVYFVSKQHYYETEGQDSPTTQEDESTPSDSLVYLPTRPENCKLTSLDKHVYTRQYQIVKRECML